MPPPPSPSPTARVAFAYKNFAAARGISHIGLGVTAANTARVLARHGVPAEVWPVTRSADIDRRLQEDARPAAGRHAPPGPVTHVVVCAPWVPTADLLRLSARWPAVVFTTVSHSNVGFLMADAHGVRLLREALDLQVAQPNVRVAGNCRRFADWATRAWGQPVACLPNLYDLATLRPAPARRAWKHGPLRVGAFGAARPLKNAITAAASVVELAATLKTDVELWLSAGRTEGGGGLPAVEQMAAGVPNVKLVLDAWKPWAQFRRAVRHMHLLMQPSFTESFNVVTADGIAEGVASVVGEAIDWVPPSWVARADDAGDLTKTALLLLNDPYAAADGQAALADYVTLGLAKWLAFLAA